MNDTAKTQTIREYLASCSIKAGHGPILEQCAKHGISLDSPWPPCFSKEAKDSPTMPDKLKTAEIIPLTVLNEDYRVAPNAFFRSALFPALRGNDKENRPYLEEEEIFSVAGIRVLFTGKQFDQSDLDVYLEILKIAQPFPLGTPVKFSAYALLKALELPTGGSNHTRLHKVLIRLCGGVIDATDHGKRYFGQLLHGGIRDEITMNYEITINPKFAVLFGFGMFSRIDVTKRRALGRNNTAKGLYGYYATHLNPDAHDIETLCKLTGTRGKNRKATLLKAHEALKEAGCINDFTVMGDKIKIDPIHTEGQARAAVKREIKARKQRSKGLRKAEDYLP